MIIMPLGWLVFDFSTALEILVFFYFIVAEIIFIMCLICKIGNNKKNWAGIIIITLSLTALIIFV